MLKMLLIKTLIMVIFQVVALNVNPYSWVDSAEFLGLSPVFMGHILHNETQDILPVGHAYTVSIVVPLPAETLSLYTPRWDNETVSLHNISLQGNTTILHIRLHLTPNITGLRVVLTHYGMPHSYQVHISAKKDDVSETFYSFWQITDMGSKVNLYFAGPNITHGLYDMSLKQCKWCILLVYF